MPKLLLDWWKLHEVLHNNNCQLIVYSRQSSLSLVMDYYLDPDHEKLKEFQALNIPLYETNDAKGALCRQLDAELFTTLSKWEQALINFGLDKDTIETKLIDTIDEATIDINLCR